MRKVLSNPAEQFAPGSVLGKMMNLRLNKIEWKVLSDAADKLDGELMTQPILARNKNPLSSSNQTTSHPSLVSKKDVPMTRANIITAGSPVRPLTPSPNLGNKLCTLMARDLCAPR